MKVNQLANSFYNQIDSQSCRQHPNGVKVYPQPQQALIVMNQESICSKNELLKNSFDKQPKQQEIPQAMKIFLKRRRIISQFLQNQANYQNTKKQSTKIPPLIKNQISHQVQYQKAKTNQLSINQSLSNTKQVISSQIKSELCLDCPICQGQIQNQMLNKKAKGVWQCGHIICKQCTKSYIEYKIRSYEQIYCPIQNCKGSFNQNSSFYCNFISLQQRKTYLKIHRFFQIHKSDQPKRLCPKEDCEGVIDLSKVNHISKCSACGFEVCSRCFSQAHSGQCEDFETKFLKQNLNLVKCQKCHNFIEKSEGCNHISCKCGYEFCEKCKKPWKKTHICKYSGLDKAEDGWGGCDWGITTKDHLVFLIKVPLKFLLVILCGLGWTIFSFFGAPLNIFLLLYWLYLLFVKPTVESIKNQQKCWIILVQIIFLPLLMLINITQGVYHLVSHIDSLLPEVTNSFRWIIRL